jgi:cyclase
MQGEIRRIRTFVGAALAGVALLSALPLAAQDAAGAGVRVEEIVPGFHLLTQGHDNVVVFVGNGGWLVVGVQAPALAERARELVRERNAGPVRWAVMLESDSALAYADGAWGAVGAQTLAQEMLHHRMSRHARMQADSGRPARARNPLPAVGFSEVVQVYMEPEEVHLIHPRAGYTDADVVVHWEEAGVVYLGNTFTNDGYPHVDYTRGGSFSGIITTVDFFLSTFGENPAKVEPIIPGRGPVATMTDLRAYRDMLTTTRERLQALLAQGKTVEEAVAAKPLADLDPRWGHGPVSTDEFVANVYRAMAAAAARRNSQQQGASAPAPAPAPAPTPGGHHHHK